MKKARKRRRKEKLEQQQQEQKEEESFREQLQILRDSRFPSAAEAARAWATGQLQSRPGPLLGLSRVSPPPRAARPSSDAGGVEPPGSIALRPLLPRGGEEEEEEVVVVEEMEKADKGATKIVVADLAKMQEEKMRKQTPSHPCPPARSGLGFPILQFAFARGFRCSRWSNADLGCEPIVR
ncbi:hypothetical protein PG985_013123 [Apiospora marii]|uniref:uncharacterized protein n=1 Tax=Apiospora marii TaxID=335849 RepID=UPI00312F44F6